MIQLTIDQKNIEVEEGTLVIKAAKQAGINIPAMCHDERTEHFTSCMLCMVKDASNQRLFPSCSVKAVQGMNIITVDEEILETRKIALELLLSEHIGDCEAPCTVTCPAHMNIPLMNRHLTKGEFEQALRVVRKDIALPSVLGRVCPAPCEGACRRKGIDGAVSICLLKRYAGDYTLLNLAEETAVPFIEKPSSTTGKKIAVIGSGPSGLAAAYYLQLRGHQCTVYEKNPVAGGNVRINYTDEQLPKDVLDKEIYHIEQTGVTFEYNQTVTPTVFNTLLQNYDAILIASGRDFKACATWNIETSESGVKIDKRNYRTNMEKVFAVGNVVKPNKLTIQSLGQGKEVAFSIDQFLKGEPVIGEPEKFNSRFGKLSPDEVAEYLKESVDYPRINPEGKITNGFSIEEVKKEAARCLHCDCRKLDHCKLRDYSDLFEANQKHFSPEERKDVKKHIQHNLVVFEPSKCIKCGICFRLTEKEKEKFGFTFIGRGFDVEIGVPFVTDFKEALTQTAIMVAEACPTGALSIKE
ncbi:MAG: (2Fe-2S)-binding protein [Bacteroidetes bacterium]|nr:(2Fe-2S)-binding protein [Bacteroidota bacterium]